MRKPILIIAALAVLAVIAVGGYIVTRPTVVEVRALLTEGGQEVTDALTWSAHKVLQAAPEDQAIRVNIVETYEPDPDNPHRFEVDPGAPVQVVAGVAGGESVEQTVTPARWRTTEHTVVLNAGQVSLDIATGGREDVRIMLSREGSTRISAIGVPPDGAVTLFPDPGAYRVRAVAGDLSDVAEVTVAAGAQANLALDVRARDVTFQLSSPLALDDSMPQASWELLPEDDPEGERRAGVAALDGTWTVRDLPYGDYALTVTFMDRDRGVFASYLLAEQTVSVGETDDAAASLAVPISFVRVPVTIEGTPPEDMPIERLAVIETDYKGMPYGETARVAEDGSGTVVFARHPKDEGDLNFAVVAKHGRYVLGLTPIGQPDPDSTIEATVTLGEGLDLCVELYSEEMCGAPETAE